MFGQAEMLTAERAAGPMGRDIDLLNGGGELLDLGLLAARASSHGPTGGGRWPTG